ncbi:cyclin-D-binding Myb-like transcription factor 1 [Saccoglossus kowalevskii]|uniref:Cyclin-D-binding Myb-like transcription factor 1-like n=1 Tax=Saccoglossus kowalevskii TaxID=10224 RepID=A0ABM0GW76_SACKO|nr:PREDICTED: cyclin-D-binding Myb-like transcription factor 1-like [Saccoglossus kowalevskii]
MKERYTLEETERLKDLHLKHGNDWAAIGTALGRSASSVKDRCRLVLKESNHSGKWSPEEEHRLADSVHSLSRTVEGESVTSGISWAAVAERVGTRSEKQCRSKWLNYLNWKQIGGTDWVKEDDLNLINRIEEMGVENDNDILWNDLCSGWSSVRSPQWLRSKWWALKRHVPNHATMNLPAIIERLKTHPGPLSKPKPERPSTTSTRLRVARLDQTYSALKSPQIVHVPIPIPQTGTSATITTTTVAPTDSEDENSSSGHQYNSYEVMQSTMTLAPGTFLIHNPHHAVALSGSPTSSDQIIVHTVPVSDALHSNENVTVQMNPQNNAQIIITSTHPDCVSSLGNADMTAAISQSDDLQHVSQSDEDLPSQITQSDLATQQHMHSQDQLMTQDGTLIEQDISGSDMTSEVSQSEPTLVIVSASSITGTTRAEYVQSTSSIVDSHLTSSAVFTLTGPILQSHCDGGDDMIGSSSDIETDKLNKLDCCDSQDTDLIKHDSCGV